MNKGKVFEGDVKNSCKNQGIYCLRLNDTSLSFIEEKNAKFTPKNPADFVLFSKPSLFLIECKSTKYKSMSIQREENDNKAMIQAHQINSLIKASNYDGVYGGFLFNFRDEENQLNDITYWLSIEDFSRFLEHEDKKSINALNIVQYGGKVVTQHKVRTHFLYDIKDLIDRIQNGGVANETSI